MKSMKRCSRILRPEQRSTRVPMKRCLIFTMAAALVLLGAAGAAEPPQRVMSLSLCTDQLLLQLLPPERITSVTYLSRESGYSYFRAEAFAVPINYGNPEEVAEQKADLVLAGTFSAPAARMLLRRIGAPLVEVPPADTFDEIRTVTRQVARAVGEEAKGEVLLAEMDAALAELARTKPSGRIVVAGWDSFGGVPGKGTLFDSILTAAGGESVANLISGNASFGGYVAFDLEQVVAMRPDILAYGNSRLDHPDLSGERLRHRVIQKLFAGRQITYPETLYSCGLPQSATVAARDLRRAILDIMTRIDRRVE
jgi:iron complex transport system substrate-binding protein